MTNIKPIRVLLVDDHEMVRRGLSVFIQSFNDLEMVGEASNGREAIQLCRQIKPNVILMDMLMPEMGGIALLYTLRERGSTVPVVMLTGHPLEKELEDLQAQGTIDWLPKPPQLEDLAVVVARALSKD